MKDYSEEIGTELHGESNLQGITDECQSSTDQQGSRKRRSTGQSCHKSSVNT